MSERLDEVLQAMRARLMQQHNVAIEHADPLLMAMSATLIIVEEAAKAGQGVQEKALDAHRGELQVLTSRWAKEAQACADTIVTKMQEATVDVAEQSIVSMCDGAAKRIEEALDQHAKILRMVAWTSALAVAVAVLAATVAMLRH